MEQELSFRDLRTSSGSRAGSGYRTGATCGRAPTAGSPNRTASALPLAGFSIFSYDSEDLVVRSYVDLDLGAVRKTCNDSRCWISMPVEDSAEVEHLPI